MPAGVADHHHHFARWTRDTVQEVSTRGIGKPGRPADLATLHFSEGLRQHGLLNQPRRRHLTFEAFANGDVGNGRDDISSRAGRHRCQADFHGEFSPLPIDGMDLSPDAHHASMWFV